MATTMTEDDLNWLKPSPADLAWLEKNPSETVCIRRILDGEVDIVDWARAKYGAEGFAIVIAHDRLGDTRAHLGPVVYALITKGMSYDDVSRRAVQMVRWYARCPISFPPLGLHNDDAAALIGRLS